MTKVDFKKELKLLYAPSAEAVVEVDVPSLNFLMIDGAGDPNHSQAYTEAVEALFSVSYAAKFMVKKAPGSVDYAVMPLEGLWHIDATSARRGRHHEIYLSDIRKADPSRWKTIIRQPMT